MPPTACALPVHRNGDFGTPVSVALQESIPKLSDNGKTVASIGSKPTCKGDDWPPLLNLPTSFAISLLLYWLQPSQDFTGIGPASHAAMHQGLAADVRVGS
jgi:hypothetical protein